MDYHDSNAGEAHLAVVRYAATASSKAGTLFINPSRYTLHYVSSCPNALSQAGPAALESRPSHKADRTLAYFSRELTILSPGIPVVSVSSRCMYPLILS